MQSLRRAQTSAIVPIPFGRFFPNRPKLRTKLGSKAWRGTWTVSSYSCVYHRAYFIHRGYERVSLQAGLFSAVLTSFLVQSIQALQPNPVQQSVYYQQQSLAMLVQISQQMASIAPQFPIPSTPPPPYLSPSPSSSDVLVNICWIVSLVCSLSAALLAILIQQWVRSYMQVFQLYDHPLKRARFRQFFFEGAKGMPALAELVPGLIHLSLFLFFVGLSDSMLGIHQAVGVSTVVPICFCGSFYL